MPLSNKSPAVLREVTPTPFVRPVQGSLLPASKARRLWLCIYLPALPLQAVKDTNAKDAADATAVFEEEKGVRKILLADKKAGAAGVIPGLAVNAALALLPTLRLQERSLLRERKALENLASWVERFTSVVSVEMPDILLLEIAGSLQLFGGLSSLQDTIVSGLEDLGFAAMLSIAPTPYASTWLARSGREACIRKEVDLAGALSELPMSCLGWPDSLNESLTGMGITHIGDCLRLPREGFARRFGVARLLELDRALGRSPDPRQSYRAPERFYLEYELAEEASVSDLLLNVCQELLVELERFLLTRQLSVQRVLFSFFHLKEAATYLTLGSMQAGRSIGHWFDLLKIKFEEIYLPAPVIAIRLRGGRSQALTAKTCTFSFSNTGRQESEPIANLVERISARIGDESIHGVTTVAEHRPHYAWSRKDPEQVPNCAASPTPRRPLWLLPEPRLLPVDQGSPMYQGGLKLLDRPERLETGWWDGGGIARDYYVAVNPAGIHVWVYQDRRSTAWYLHGIFG